MGITDRYTTGELSATTAGQTVTSADFTDVMTRLNVVRTQQAYGLPQLPPSAAAPGGLILKSHLAALRSAVN